MRLLAVLALLAAALLAWLALVPRQRAAPVEIGARTAALELDGGSRLAAVTVEGALESARSERRAEQEARSEVTAPHAGTCRLFGRVIDDTGAPLSLARVVLREWGSFPEIVAEHETVSGTGGMFELSFAPPAGPKQVLQVAAKPFHLSTERWFGDVAVAEGRQLVAGDVDAGDIELERCGEVIGLVRTADGRGVGEVGVLLRSNEHGARGTRSNADGSYTVPEVRPGVWLVTLENDEWLPPAKVFVDVEAFATARAPDLVAVATPTIEGRIVDAEGAGLPNVLVRAGLDAFYQQHSTTTDQDGRFVLRVRPEEENPRGEDAQGDTVVQGVVRDRFTLSVPESDEFLAFGGVPGDPTCTFAAGARDVRIVLTRTPEMTFRVIDAATRAPVERFSLRVVQETRKFAALTNPAFEHHEGGLAVHRAGPLSSVTVIARGYAPATLPVVADPGTANAQTIALARASGITGRLRLSGRPVPGASVGLTSDRTEVWAPKALGSGWNLDRHRRPESVTDSDEGGLFVFSDLAAGTYGITIEPSSGAFTSLRGLQVPAERVLDLGVIEIAPEASVRGRMVTQAGEAASGFTITLDDCRASTVAASGDSFEFRGLSAGPHWLVWSRAGDHRTPDSRDPRRVEFVLREGETRELVIDASPLGSCTLSVRVSRHGLPAAGLYVVLAQAQEGAFGESTRTPLGRTDADGRAQRVVEAGRSVHVLVQDDTKRVVGRSVRPLDLVAGGNFTAEIDVRGGRLIVQVPASIPRPETGRVRVEFPSDPQVAPSEARTPYPGQPRTLRSGAEWTGDVLDFGEIPVGIYDLRISIERFERDARAQSAKHGRFLELRAPYEARVEIRDGDVTTVVVP